MTRFDRVRSATTIPSVISRTRAWSATRRCASSSPTRRGRDESRRSVARRLTATAARWPSCHHSGTVGDRLLEDPGGEGVDEPALLRQGQEVLGRDEAEGRVGPPQECLDSHHLAGAQVDLGLVVQGK